MATAVRLDAVPAIEAKDLTVELGGQKVLDGVSFAVRQGEFMGVIGPNGAGKTTLLKVLLGLYRPVRGEVLVMGRPPQRLGAGRHAIGYVAQRPEFDRRFPVSVLDVVMMGRVSCRGLGRRFRSEDRKAALESLELVGARELAARPIGELSGGQQQRVFLARALCSHTQILLLDEPNTGLDQPSQQEFYDLLERLKTEHGLTIVVVSHDLSMISRYADRLLCINKKTHVHGSPSEVSASPELEAAYGCEFDRIAGRLGGPSQRG